MRQDVKKRLKELVRSTFIAENWLESHGLDLDEIQTEIFNAVCDQNITSLLVVGARGLGKTYSCSAAFVKFCEAIPNFVVIIAGPKEDQAKRVVAEAKKICKGSPSLRPKVNWRGCSQTKFEFLNGSLIYGLSASEQAQQEGPHCHILAVDECHRVSSMAMRQRLQPMLSGMENPKVIKIGITIGKGQFRDSFRSANYSKLIYPWHKCPRLLLSGYIEVEGMKVSKLLLQYMPLSYKKKYFPNSPELHYPGDFDEVDFDTQYEMNWREDVDKLITEEEQALLVGEHSLLTSGVDGEEYYFGLDFAGGSEIPEGPKHDFTSLTVGRKVANRKEVVARYKWQGDVTIQLEEIVQLIHPQTGKFKTKFGIGDYTGCGIGPVDMLKSRGIPIKGIMYQKNDPLVGKNYKNSMTDETVYELKWNRFKLPKKETLESDSLHKEGYNQWGDVERKKKSGINDEIKSPPSTPGSVYHDDMFCSDIMFCYATDKYESFKGEIRKAEPIKLARPIITPGTLIPRMSMGGPRKSILK